MKLPGIFNYFGLLVAGASAFSMSTLFSALKPVLLTRFVEQVGVNEFQAGLIVAMPFVGIAVSSVLQKKLSKLFGFRQLIFTFGLLLVVGELVSAAVFQLINLVLVIQLLCGVSVGVLMGACSRFIATSEFPNQMFGFVDMMAVFLMSFMITGVGFSVGLFGLQGGYLFAAGISLIFSLLMLVYRRPEASNAIINEFKTALHIGYREVTVVCMGVLFVTSSGMGFAFLFTLALNLGLDYATAGSYLGVLVLVSASACQLGGWCGARFGPLRPLAGAFLTCAVGWFLAINATSQLVFMVSLVPAIFALQFNFPILLALSGSLDKEGQWAAIASPLLTSGFAWAAIVAGLIVNRWNLEALATATVVGMAMCLLLLIPSRQSIDKGPNQLPLV